MAVITSRTGARSWATPTDWVGDACPVDNVDSAVIAADCQMLMDQDQSGYTGILGVTVEGHATTPGMLYWKDGTDGYLKIQTGYNLLGTSGAAKGRLLVNSNGTWGATGALTFANKAVIDLGSTAATTTNKLNAQYLDIALYGYNSMAHKYLTTYGVRHTVTASAATDTLTKVSHGLANNTPVMIMSSGAIPTPLIADTIYYVVDTAADTFKLASVSGAAAIDLTSDGSGTIEVYTGAASGADPVNVFEDVSAETGWTADAGHNRVVVCNAGPQNYDQQRLTITTLDTDHIHLSAPLDSLQYPGVRIYLSSRNASIRSACTTALNIVDYSSAATSSGVFQCEIVSTAGTGTTFYGSGIYSGTGHTVETTMGCSNGISGGIGHIVETIVGCSSGTAGGTGHTVETIVGCIYGISTGTSCTVATIMGCTYGIYNGTGHTVETITGCNIGISNGTGHTVATIMRCIYGIHTGTDHIVETIMGCSYGIYTGTGHIVTGKIGYNASDEVVANAYDFRFGSVDTHSLNIVLRGVKIPASPIFNSRNIAGVGSQGNQGVFSEDHGKALGASYAYLPVGDVIKNSVTVRGGGAATSLEVVPLSNCSIYAPIQIFEWTELSVAASAQNKSVYIRADSAWSVYPIATELYVEAEYISNGVTFARTTVSSTAVLSDGSTWVQFTIPEFTPAVAGHVRYRAYLKKYEAEKKIYVDNMLVSA